MLTADTISGKASFANSIATFWQAPRSERIVSSDVSIDVQSKESICQSNKITLMLMALQHAGTCDASNDDKTKTNMFAERQIRE
jgi:hypothetical protein